MANEQTLRAIITVVDRFSAPIAAMQERLKRFGAPLREIGEQFARLGEVGGINTMIERMRVAGETTRQLGKRVEALAAPVLGLGALGGIAGLAEAVRKTAEFSEQLSIASEASGLSTQQLGGLSYAARIAGVDFEQMTRGVEYLNRNLGQAQLGRATKDAKTWLDQLNISETPGHLTSTSDALMKISAQAKAFADSGQTQKAAAMVSALFGERRGVQLLPLLTQGPQHIQELSAKAAQLGLAPDKEQTEAGKKFHEQLNTLTGATQGFEYAIAFGLFPELSKAVDKMTEWLTVNRKWIAADVKDAVKQFADYLKTIDWDRVKAGLKGLLDDAKWLFRELGGVKRVMELIALIEFGPLIAAWGKVGTAAAGAAAKFALIPAASFLATLGSLIPEIYGLRDAFAALSLAADANPLGAAVAVAALLGAAAYELVEHWKTVKSFFVDLWNGIASSFTAAWAKIQPIIDKLNAAAHFVSSFVPDQAPAANNIRARNIYEQHHSSLAARMLAAPGVGRPPAAAGATTQRSDIHVTIDGKNMPAGAAVHAHGDMAPGATMNLGEAMPY